MTRKHIKALDPTQAKEEELKAWANVRMFVRMPEHINMAGYKSLEDYIRTRAQEIELGLQKWERETFK